MISVNIYGAYNSYQADIWRNGKIVAEMNKKCNSYDAVGQIRKFVKQYNYKHITDELGIVDAGSSW